MRLVWIVIPLVLIGIIGAQNADGVCMPNLDWPQSLCPSDVANIPGPSTEEYRANMEQYYEYKGAEWMEMKRIDMENAIKNDVLLEWTLYEPTPDAMGNNRPNANVWFYYNLHEQAPNIDRASNMLKNPREQVERGILPSNVACNGMLIFKNSDNSPTCVYRLAYEKLLERGWGDKAFIDYIIDIESEHNIRYKIKDGSLSIWDISINLETGSMIMKVHPYNGILIVEFPRSLIDPKIDNYNKLEDKPFKIIATERGAVFDEEGNGWDVYDEVEIIFDEIKTTEKNRTLSIPFTRNMTQIEFTS